MTASERVLVTGATGLLGSHVVQQLRTAGGEVFAMVREASPGKQWLRDQGAKLLAGDVLQPESYRDTLRQCTGVIHCAGYVAEGGDDSSYRSINLEATRLLLEEMIRRPNPPRLIHISTLGVYPLADHEGTREEDPIADQGIDPYLDSKIAAERLLASYHDKLPIVTLRPGFMYGERDRVVLPRIVQFLKRGVMVYIGSRGKRLDNTYAGNAAYACLLALQKDEAIGRTYNVTDSPLVTKEEFITAVARAIKVRDPLVTLPDGLSRWLVGKIPWLTWARYKFLGKNLDFSIERIERELGYRPPWSFGAGMERALAWHREGAA